MPTELSATDLARMICKLSSVEAALTGTLVVKKSTDLSGGRVRYFFVIDGLGKHAKEKVIAKKVANAAVTIATTVAGGMETSANPLDSGLPDNPSTTDHVVSNLSGGSGVLQESETVATRLSSMFSAKDMVREHWREANADYIKCTINDHKDPRTRMAMLAQVNGGIKFFGYFDFTPVGKAGKAEFGIWMKASENKKASLCKNYQNFLRCVNGVYNFQAHDDKGTMNVADGTFSSVNERKRTKKVISTYKKVVAMYKSPQSAAEMQKKWNKNRIWDRYGIKFSN